MLRRPVLLLAALPACAGPLPREEPTPTSCVPEIDAADYPGAPMTSFDPLGEGGSWRKGDRALVALRLQKGPGDVRRWLLDLEVVDDLLEGDRVSTWGGRTYRSSQMLVQVRVADADGETLGQTMVRAPRDWLAGGLAPSCEATDRIRALPLQERQEAALALTDTWILGFVTLTSLLELVQNDRVLSEILWEVVRTPSFFTLLGSIGGVSLTVSADFEDMVGAIRPSRLPDTGPVWCVPVELLVGNEAVLYCNLMVTSPRPPYALCGGIVGFQATHPSDPDIRFSYMLLGARQGRVPAPE